MALPTVNEHYHALVDMGRYVNFNIRSWGCLWAPHTLPLTVDSNGIRFSISDLSPPTARVMPTVYQDRSDISLYDAQYVEGGKGPIPRKVIEEVLSALLRFKRTCEDFGVRKGRVRIVATEATRNAVNSQDYRRQIKLKTDWEVEMLEKEEEGRIGAMGIASSFSSIKGLALDLGGGSVQMSWLIAKNGQIETSPKGSVSFPYGAAALTKLLEGAPKASEQEKLQNELAKNFETAITDLEIPSSLTKEAEKDNGFTLYLSGGGFRGWGYILMSLHATQPYPIPLINGFRVPRSSFVPKLSESAIDDSTFRISSRRASQVPAVKFLILALTRSLPSISNIYFAQGGLREGLLFSTLPAPIRAQDPLVAATLKYAPASTPTLVSLLHSSIPLPPSAHNSNPNIAPAPFHSPAFLTSVIHLLTAHAHLPKDIRSAAALRSTTTGLLASAHGISHDARALLALVLCERWGHDLSPSDTAFHAKLQSLAGPAGSWWAKYVGRVARGLGNLFPAGLVRDDNDDRKSTALRLQASWRPASAVVATKVGEKVKTGSSSGGGGTDLVIVLEIGRSGTEMADVLDAWGASLEKVGKRKHWVGGGASGDGDEEAFGCRVVVRVEGRG